MAGKKDTDKALIAKPEGKNYFEDQASVYCKS